MELAIPLIALGGMYVISNQSSHSNQKKKEKFTNMGATPNYLPNTQMLPQNYPTMNEKELVDTVQQYPNPNAATDRYFDQNSYERKSTGNIIPQVYSLSGNYLESTEFKHNNMVPFFGSKIHEHPYKNNNAESVLDNMIGSGSQLIKKIEQAPLFKPEDNVQWSYGAPNMSDFYQSRVNPGMLNNGVKPFEPVKVGPGLNKGFGSEGSGGFNSGMESRDQWLPKTVDELRVATNPKQEYSLDNLEGPAGSLIKNIGILGKVEKYTPDTYFINSQDRWLTTTGGEKGTRSIAQEIDRPSHRNSTTTEYAGVANAREKTAGYVPGVVEKSKRVVLENFDVAHSSAAGKGPVSDQAFVRNHIKYVNNRGSNAQPDTMRSSFTKAVGAVIAPIMDILKPSKKEEYSDNIRIYGNSSSIVPGNYVINPGNTTGTTIKETTIFAPNSYIGNQTSGGYYANKQTPIHNQRDTTNCSEIGNPGAAYGDRIYDADYRQTNNETKELASASRINHGNTQIYNQTMNVNIAKLESDRDNPRMWAPTSIGIPRGPVKENYGKQNNIPEVQNMNDRISPDLLNAFRDNPFTHSLTYAV
jgi:hypothetical protein